MRGEVTEIRTARGKATIVFASGASFSMPAPMARECPGLTAGTEADTSELEKYLSEHGMPYALAQCAQMASRRDYTRREVKDALLVRGYPEEIAQQAVEQASRAGLISDDRSAQSLLRRRSRTHGRGAIAQEMRRRGIDRETAQNALEEMDEETEKAGAARLAQKLLARGKTREQAYAALLRRGYSRTVAYGAVMTSKFD